MASREQPIRDALAGVFVTTPLMVHIYLGGTVENFDDYALFRAESHLRTHGYWECDVYPRGPQRRTRWRRSMKKADLWPEDLQYIPIDPGAELILRAIVLRYAEAKVRDSEESDEYRYD